MDSIMQLTIINKITLGFGLFGCLLLFTSVLSYFGLNDIRKSAEDVVERKMPEQTSMVRVKTEILSLSVITANGFYVENATAFEKNKALFDELSVEFTEDLNNLKALMPSNKDAQKAIADSLYYVESSNNMYAAIKSRIQIESQRSDVY